MRTGEFSDFSFAGFSAEIQHIEFLPDSLAEVFMSYAVYGSEDGFNIKLLSAGDSTTFQEWNFDENKKTGIITFYVKQNVSNNFIFDLKIKARSSWRYQEKFSFSSMKQSAIALPIEEKNNPY